MKERIKKLLQITEELSNSEQYKIHNRKFTLDGKLIGDIGEVLATEKFNITLYPPKKKDYDAFEIGTNKQIQIKSTMRGYFTFPFDPKPDMYLLAIKINCEENKDVCEVIYNGPGKIVLDKILEKKLKPYKESYYSITMNMLKDLNAEVKYDDRIKEKIVENR